MRSYFFLTAFLSCCFSLLPLPGQTPSSWEVIRDEIITPNCAICHYSGSAFAIQSGLVLTPDSAYQNLVNVPPKNDAARDDGLMRVSADGGGAGLFRSFMWEKIDAPNQEHFYNDHPNYGAQMPLGLPPLTNGQLAYIKAWIEGGAPEEGVLTDTALLADTTRYTPPPFLPLDPPAQGIQLHLGPFDVWPSEVHDREFLYFIPHETTEDLLIKRYEISYREGSHHFIMYNYPTGKPTPQPEVFRDLRDQNGNINPLVALQLGTLFPFQMFIGSQVPRFNYYFPPGVALRLPAGSGFDFNVHSVNRSNTTRPGEVYVNLHTVDPGEVQFVADYDNFGNFDINLPPQQITTLSKTFFFTEQRHIIQMWSHSHEHTLEFRIEGVGGAHDGELLYWTSDWEHPPLLQLDPPLTFEAGDGIRLVTTYHNWTDEWIRFGPLSSDEMQFLFYIYYTGDIATGIDDAPPAVIRTVSLLPNYPNPFNPETHLRFQVADFGFVELQIFDMSGRLVRTLLREHRPAGTHSVTWNGRDETGRAVSSGVYFYRLNTAGQTLSRKMLLIR